MLGLKLICITERGSSRYVRYISGMKFQLNKTCMRHVLIPGPVIELFTFDACHSHTTLPWSATQSIFNIISSYHSVTHIQYRAVLSRNKSGLNTLVWGVRRYLGNIALFDDAHAYIYIYIYIYISYTVVNDFRIQTYSEIDCMPVFENTNTERNEKTLTRYITIWYD